MAKRVGRSGSGDERGARVAAAGGASGGAKDKRAPTPSRNAAKSGGLRSMTGYGSATVPIPNGRITVEIRSVNQRFLDVRITAPREYAAWEATCREAVRTRVARGRVE